MITDTRMKQFKLSLLSLFFAIILRVCVFDISCVSAATGISWLEPALGFEAGNNVSDNDIEQVKEAFAEMYDRLGLSYTEYYIMINQIYRSNIDNSIIVTGDMFPSSGYNWQQQRKSFNGVDYEIYTCDRDLPFTWGIDQIRNMNELNFSSNTAFYKRAIMYNSSLGFCQGELRDYGNGVIQSGMFPPPSQIFIYIYSVTTPFNPVLDPILNTPYNLKIQSEGFVEWLLNTGKYLEIKSELLENHVGGWVNIFAEYGSNSKWFRDVAIQFMASNRITMGIEDANLALSKTKALYQEYLSLKNDTYRNHLQRRTWDTNNIVPVTNDTDNILIVDTPSDTIDISILRDILRALINTGNIINDNFNILFDKLDNLDNTVNIVNNGGDDLVDFSPLWTYSIDVFNDDLQNFVEDVEDVQNVPQGYIDTINQNALMPENMLADKNSLTVNIPTITGFTTANNGITYSTQTGTYTLHSSDYPWLDPIVQKIKRFGSIILILGYLVHLRYRIPELVRGE